MSCFKGLLLGLISLILIGSVYAQGGVELVVPATSNPWMAGQPDGFGLYCIQNDAVFGPLGTAPTYSPTAVSLDLLPKASFLTFEVEGDYNIAQGHPAYDMGPEGGVMFFNFNWGGFHEDPALFDARFTDDVPLSGIGAPMGAFGGVFLDSTGFQVRPDSVDFRWHRDEVESRSFKVLDPLIQQVFFIGDGLSGFGNGEIQLFRIPDGADELHLGVITGGTTGNIGEIYVTIRQGFDCVGFEAPLMENPVILNKKTKVLPLVVSLTGRNGIPISDLDLVSPPVLEIDFNSEIEEGVTLGSFRGAADSGNQFLYSSGRWQMNLSTEQFTAPGTYTLRLVSGNQSEYGLRGCQAQIVVGK